MANFRNSKKFGINQFALAANVGTDFHTLDGFGQQGPARASTEESYEEYPPIDVEGYLPCLTEVIDWPFSEDENGIAFDQSNLYGVRSVCWRLPIGDGGGDDNERWIAVPKTLPSGYTIQGRCRHLSPPQIADHLEGIGPYGSGSINIRSVTSDDVYGADPGRYWTPMNMGDQGYESPLGPHTSTISSIPDSDANTDVIATDHIGFRAGGRLELTISDPTTGFSHSGTLRFYRTTTGDVSDAELIGTATYAYTSNGSVQYFTINLPAMPSIALGVKSDFFMLCENSYQDNDGFSFWNPSSPPTYTTVFGGVGVNGGGTYYLGPRTDVPLWYFAATKNKCAPGGLVT